MSEQMIVGYWSIRGLGAPLRLMCEYAGASYQARLHNVEAKEGGVFEKSDWFVPKEELKKKNPLINLPYIVDDGLVITQTNACLEYLGDKFKLMGKTSAERSECTMLLCQAKDLRDDMVGTFYGRGDDPAALANLMSSASLDKFEWWLQAKGTVFLIADSPSCPDFHLWELLDQLVEASECAENKASPFTNRPLLKKLYDTMKGMPFMKAYHECGLGGLPINQKMAKFGAMPKGGSKPWDFSKPQTFAKGTIVRAKKNAAFVFVKPHAAMPNAVNLVKGYFAGKGISVLSEGRIAAEEIDSKKLIDQHYYAIASKATILKPEQLNVPAPKFEAQFGLTWEAALAQGNVYNAMDGCKVLGITADEMDKQWGICKKAKKLVKFGGGFYCGLIEIAGKPSVYVFNGFFMSMRSKFTVPGESIYYFSVEWDGAELSWADFRGQALGPTDPADAPASSLRGMVLADWKALGLAAVPNVGDNGVHASASPFEALAERMNWLGADCATDSFGAAMLAAGIDEATVKAWSVDPQVNLPGGGKGSLFDAVEDMDSEECLATLMSIKACQ